jgi:hypothetical protein
LTTLESILLDACAKQVHLAADRIPKVRFFDDPGMTPMVIGILDPVLLLPTSMRHTTEREFNDLDLMAIFAHELTHVRRRDYLINLTARLLSLPVAYHPVSRALHARMRQAQEMICDASAAGAFDSKCSYARSLLAVADRIVQPFSSIEAPTLFNSARNTLEERIMNLTTEHQPIHFSLRLARVTAGAAILILAVGTTASLHIRSAAHLDGSARVVYAAQIQQAPQPMPAPASAPAAAAEPKPQTSSQGVIRHPVRDLDPEQRATMERNMAEARDQVRKLNDPAFKRQLSEGITLANSAEFKKQMADLKIQLKQLDSPEFRQQILGAQKAIKLPDIKVDLENLKVQLNSPEFKSEIENAKLHALQAQANADQRNAETLKRLDEAAAAVAEARRKVNDANVQEQLDNAQKSIWEAAKNMR